MFDNLEDWFKNNKTPIPPSDGSRGNGGSGGGGMFGGFGINEGGDMPEEVKRIQEIIKREMGGSNVRMHTVPGGTVMEVSGSRKSGSHKSIKDKLQGITDSLAYIAEQKKVKPRCLDAVGTQLKVGDVLSVPGGEHKTVLTLGYGFATLSRTEDQAKVDGVWFENEIRELNFILKK